MIQRRAFLTGLGAVIASPAIVRASSLMPVKVIPADIGWAHLYQGREIPFLPHPGMDLNEDSLEWLASKLNEQHNDFRNYLMLRSADHRETMRFVGIPDMIRGAA